MRRRPRSTGLPRTRSCSTGHAMRSVQNGIVKTSTDVRPTPPPASASVVALKFTVVWKNPVTTTATHDVGQNGWRCEIRMAKSTITAIHVRCTLRITGSARASANFNAIQLNPQIERQHHERDVRAAPRAHEQVLVHQSRKCSMRRATACGWSWCSMWLASLTYSSVPFGTCANRRATSSRGSPPRRKPLRHVRMVRGDPQHGTRDAAPDGVDVVDSGRRRERKLVLGIGAQTRRAVGHFLGPIRRQEFRLVTGEPAVVLLQAIGDGCKAGVWRERRRIAHRVEPGAQLVRRAIGGVAGNAERVERDDARSLLGAGARPQHRDVAAKAVPDDIDALVRREGVHESIEVGDVVGKPVAVLRRLRRSEPAPIGREHVPLPRKRVDQELEGRRHVHPSVQEEELGCARVAPRTDVIREPAHVDELRARKLHVRAKGRGLNGPEVHCERPRVGRVRLRCDAPFGPRLDLRSRPPCSLDPEHELRPLGGQRAACLSLPRAWRFIYACIARDRPASRRGSCRPCRSDRRPCARCRDPSSSHRQSPLDTPAGILADSRAEAAPARRARSVRMAWQASRA